jgi:hypothetical protein
MTRMNILSLGAGVQSTTLYLMYCKGGFLDHTIDAAIFADTGDEPKAVYRHLEWLQSLNGPPILIRAKGRLSDDLMRGENPTRQRFASIPAFTVAVGESAGKIRRQCSKEYKIDVIERTVRRDILGLEQRQRIPKHVKVTQIIGISLDEAGRAMRIERNKREKRSPFAVRFPLIENFMTRANCLEWLLTHGSVPHETPRSACVFCPYHSDLEWDRIKREDPEGWALSVRLDHRLREAGAVVNRKMDQRMYLHRSCQPLDLVQLDVSEDPRKRQLAMNFAAECMGVCGV